MLTQNDIPDYSNEVIPPNNRTRESERYVKLAKFILQNPHVSAAGITGHLKDFNRGGYVPKGPIQASFRLFGLLDETVQTIDHVPNHVVHKICAVSGTKDLILELQKYIEKLEASLAPKPIEDFLPDFQKAVGHPDATVAEMVETLATEPAPTEPNGAAAEAPAAPEALEWPAAGESKIVTQLRKGRKETETMN